MKFKYNCVSFFFAVVELTSPKYGLSWKMFCVIWKKKSIFCCSVQCTLKIIKLSLVNSVFQFTISLLIIYLLVLLIIERKVLIPLIILVDLCISPRSSISFCLKYLKFVISAQVFRIACSSWWMDPFIIMEWDSLSWVIFFALKYTLILLLCLSSCLLMSFSMAYSSLLVLLLFYFYPICVFMFKLLFL